MFQVSYKYFSVVFYLLLVVCLLSLGLLNPRAITSKKNLKREIYVFMEFIFNWGKMDTLCHLNHSNFMKLALVLSPSTTEEIEA